MSTKTQLNNAEWEKRITDISDFDACNALAHLQDLSPSFLGAVVVYHNSDGHAHIYQPTTNKAQALDLVVNFGIERRYDSDKGYYWQSVDGEFDTRFYEQPDNPCRAICQAVLMNFTSPELLDVDTPRVGIMPHEPFSCIACQSRQLEYIGDGFLEIGEYDEASGSYASEGDINFLECKNCGTVCSHIDIGIPADSE